MSTLLLGTEALREEAERAPRMAPVWLLEPPVNNSEDRHSDASRRAFRQRWSIEDETKLLVVVSRLDHDMKAEGIAQVIESVRRLADPGLRLAIVGGGDAEGLLAGLADAANAALGWPAVIMTGPLRDPGPAYSAADLVLAMGGAALRALAFEKPLIVLGEDGFSKPFAPDTLAYFLRNGYYGRGHDGDPVNALSGQIVSTIELAASTDLATWGGTVLQSRYSLTTITDRLLAIYDQALRQTSLPRRLVDVAYVVGLYQARRFRQTLAAHRPLRSLARKSR